MNLVKLSHYSTFGAGCCALVMSSSLAQERPAALVRLEKDRAALKTGQIDWIWERDRRPEPWHYTTRFAGPDNLQILRGNEDGVISRSRGGYVFKGPHFSMWRDGEIWQYKAESARAENWERANRSGVLPDLRALGLSYAFSMADAQETLWDDRVNLATPRKYRVTNDKGLEVVTAETDYGLITWWIDPKRGGLPVRVTLEQDGRIVNQSRSTPKKFDGAWFPERVEFFRSSFKAGKEPYDVVRITSVVFNQPDMPRRLHPRDIGIDAGVSVETRDEKMKSTGMMQWDGEKLVTMDEYAKRWRAGELHAGPMYLRNVARLRVREKERRARATGEASAAQGTTPLSPAEAAEVLGYTVKQPDSESLWEAYTRHFIEKYKLAADQEQKALSILKSCQEQGRKYLGSRKTSFDRIARRMKEITESEVKDKAEQRAALVQERKKLRKPIDDIFEKQLKPRLDKLPTRTQRAAAEQSGQQQKPPAERESNRGGGP